MKLKKNIMLLLKKKEVQSKLYLTFITKFVKQVYFKGLQ